MNNRVLLIDNDIVFGGTVTAPLEAAGYEVHYQTTCSNLIGVINSFNPNVLILDCGLGNGFSIEAAQRAKLFNHKLPIIFLASNVESPFVIRAIEKGGDLVLDKPVDIGVLVAFVNKYTGSNSYTMFKFGNSILDVITRQVYVNSQETPQKLNRSEYEILRILIVYKNELVRREVVGKVLYGDKGLNTFSTNNSICRIRNILSKDTTIEIKTIRSAGYMLVEV